MYLPGRGGQFVHAADVSNIDIEERSKKVAVYELKVERIPFPVALHTCWSSSETTCCPSTFYHRDFHAPWREDVIESLIERTTWIVVDSSRSVAWTIRFTFHYFNLFELRVIQPCRIFAILIYFLKYKFDRKYRRNIISWIL